MIYIYIHMCIRCADKSPRSPICIRGLGLLFSIGICNALLDGLGQLKIPGLTFEVWETGAMWGMFFRSQPWGTCSDFSKRNGDFPWSNQQTWGFHVISKILSKKNGDLWGFMNRHEHFANKAWGLVETWTSEEPPKTGLKQIRMGKPANHMHETWPNPSQLAGAYHCGSLFRLGLVLHLAAGQCLCDVLRAADCQWRCFSFETCLVERKTEGLKVKHHQSSWTINKHHQPSSTINYDAKGFVSNLGPWPSRPFKIEVIFDVAKHSSEGKAVKAGNLPRQVAGIVPPDYTEPEEVLEDVEIIMRSYG